jgi:hypothetical protein
MPEMGSGKVVNVLVMTTTQRDALEAVEGMVIFNSTTDQLEEYDGTQWQAVGQVAIDAHAADPDAHHSEEIPCGRAQYNSTQALSIPGSGCFTVGTGAYSGDRVYYFPIKVDTPITLDRLAIEVTSGAASGKKARLGIYKADVNWQPTDLVVDGGEVAVDTTGVITVTIDEILQEGKYVLAYTSNGAPTLRLFYSPQSLMGYSPTLGASPVISQARVDKTYAVLSDPGIAWDTVGASSVGFIHWVLVRVATP